MNYCEIKKIPSRIGICLGYIANLFLQIYIVMDIQNDRPIALNDPNVSMRDRRIFYLLISIFCNSVLFLLHGILEYVFE
jgi:hypothetical protein